MGRIILVVLALVAMASFSYAAEGDTVKATEPVGAVVETSGVVIGKVTSVVEESLGGQEGSLVMAEPDGKTRIFPVDPTVKIIDNTFNALTFNQLKGREVSVEYSKDASGKEKAKSVKVIK
jgi:ABC-type transporter Mla subunit MlaD